MCSKTCLELCKIFMNIASHKIESHSLELCDGLQNSAPYGTICVTHAQKHIFIYKAQCVFSAFKSGIHVNVLTRSL